MSAAEQVRDLIVNKLHVMERQVGQLEAEMELLREVRDYAEHCIERDKPEPAPKPLLTIGGVLATKCSACGWLVAHDGCGKGCCREDCIYGTRPSRYTVTGQPVACDA